MHVVAHLTFNWDKKNILNCPVPSLHCIYADLQCAFKHDMSHIPNVLNCLLNTKHYNPLLCSNIVQLLVNLNIHHISTRAINVTSDDRNCVKYKRTIQDSEQLWLSKLDWWWRHRTRKIRNTADTCNWNASCDWT